jgi:hypothetical protein
MFGYDNLKNFYSTNFALVQHHKYSLSDIENMMPWERHIYLDMLKEHIRQQEEQRRDQEVALRRRR